MRIFLHLDLDCFFASVETVRCPSLRGVPVCVGGLRGQRGIVSCPNYEARAYGVRTAMSLRAAEQLLPLSAVFLRGNHALYGEYSHRVMALLGKFTPDVRQKSIDEALLEVGGCLHFWNHDPARMARAMKECVCAETGLTVSVGAAPNPLCAKIAAGLGKPDGLVVVRHGDVRGFVAPLPIDAVPGIGTKTSAFLHGRGIRTIADLMSRPAVASQFAGLLEALLDETGMRGGDEHEPADHSISRDRTFGEDTAEKERITAVLFVLMEKCCKELRSEGCAASTVTVKVRFADFTTVQKQTTLPSAVSNEEELFAAAKHLLDELLPPCRFLRLIGVKVSHLSPLEGQQLLLDGGRSEQLHELHCRIDALQKRHGERSVQWGIAAATGHRQAPEGREYRQ